MPNPHIAAATTLGGHVLLRASAGTGKTHALVAHYVSLVVHHDVSPKNIVTVTFTRKAAQELKARIRRALVAAGSDTKTLNALYEAPIGNFHGLCLILAKRLAAQQYALPHRAPGVLGDGEDLALFVEAAQSAWFCGSDPVVVALHAAAPHLEANQGLMTALYQAISRAREEGRPVDARLFYAEDVKALQSMLHADLIALHRRILDEGSNLTTAFAKTTMANLRAAADKKFPLPSDDLVSWAAAWSQLFAGLTRRGKLGEIYRESDKAMVQDGIKGLLGSQLLADVAPHLGVLVAAAWQRYTALKELHNVQDFADVILQFTAYIDNDIQAQQRLRQQIHHVLVDEVQDANQAQRQLVHLLAGLSGASVQHREVSGAPLFVVGDWKQSIYGFRGAEPKMFAQFAQDVQSQGGRVHTLDTSYRSRPALVDAINAMGHVMWGDAYESLVALPPKHLAGDAPALVWLPPSEREGDKTARTKNLFAQEAEMVARSTQDIFRRQPPSHSVALLLPSMTKSKAFVDALAARGIAAVVARGGNLFDAPIVVDCLALMAWLVDHTLELEAATALRSPLFGLWDEDLLLVFSGLGRQADALQGLRQGIVKTDPVAEALSPGACVDQYRCALLRLQHAADVLPMLVDVAQSASALTMLLAIEHHLDVRAVALGQPGGPQALANLDRLEAIAHAYDLGNQPSAKAFALAMRHRLLVGDKEPLPAVAPTRAGAVTISTIHQAKGLQYDTVLLAQLSRPKPADTKAVRYVKDQGLMFKLKNGGQDCRTWAWQKAVSSEALLQQEERMRLLYVAMTRAKEQLIIIGDVAVSEQDFSNRVQQALLPYAAELPEVEAPKPPTFDERSIADILGSPAQAKADCSKKQAGKALPIADAPQPPVLFEMSVSDLVKVNQDKIDGSAGMVSRRLPTLGNEIGDDYLGTAAHAILASLQWLPPAKDFARWLEISLAHHASLATDAQRAALQHHLLVFLRSELGQMLIALGPQHRRHEHPFCLPVTQQTEDQARAKGVLRGRIDLLVWHDDAPMIVDFKYASRDVRHDSYLIQLDAYAWAAAQLCGHCGDIATRLVYLRDSTQTAEHISCVSKQKRASGLAFARIAEWSVVLQPPWAA